MTDLQLIDWDLLQLQYEVLHESVESIAAAHSVSVTTLEYAIDEKGWERKPINDIKDSWDSLDTLEDGIEGVTTALRQRNQLIQLLKVASFNTRYTTLESKAITKLGDIIDDIDSMLPSAPMQMKEVVISLKELKAMSENSAGLGEGSGEGVGDGRMMVNIINKVEKATEEQATPIEIEVNKPKLVGISTRVTHQTDGGQTEGVPSATKEKLSVS